MSRDSSVRYPDDSGAFSAGLEACPFPRRHVMSAGRALVTLRTIDPAQPQSLDVVSLPGLVTRTETEATLPLGALIFHCGRCGSTLLARLLALAPSNRVFAEPDVLAKFLWQYHAEISSGRFGNELRAFIRSFGLGPREHERRLIVKLSSHALIHLPALRAAFPDVPFFYLYREPSEVIASLLASEPRFLRPESRRRLETLWGAAPGDPSREPLANWVAWYIERNLCFARDHRAQFAATVDYCDHAAGYLQLAERMSGQPLPADSAEVTRTLGRYSKDPSRGFNPASAQSIATKSDPLATPTSAQAYADLRTP